MKQVIREGDTLREYGGTKFWPDIICVLEKALPLKAIR
ncbi:Uncharacterised protein [Klebsiella michiganensis]|uniref:Uncharacterized protein n=1 Tax=Klebsiella michiganensis TaxID=1134687 RepID=A0A7H4N0D2_9ENTR|nr:Uncharacterised protein [Klebsiella michiganensis]